MRPRKSVRKYGIPAICALVPLGTRALAQSPVPRQVAAPASDVLSGVVRLPDPASAPSSSHAAILPLRFERAPDGPWISELAVPVERDGPLSLALLAPDAGTWDLLAREPGRGSARHLDSFAGHERRVADVAELPGWAVDRRDLPSARAGAWTFRVEARGPRAPSEGWLLVSADRELGAEAYATTLELVGGGTIGIAARASGTSGARVDRARVVLQSPSGVAELAMADDGLHEDGAAGDGTFGALVPDTVRGSVLARAELAGTTGEGLPFLRSVLLSFPVIERRLLLDGTAALDGTEIAIGAFPVGPAAKLHVSAELWGRAPSGTSVPVCWLSRMLQPVETADGWTLPLALDPRWLDVADAAEPFELREVRAQDPDTEVVFDRIGRMPLRVRSLPVRNGPRTRTVLPEMLTGGTALATSATSTTGGHAAQSFYGTSPALMLVHGYCSGGSIWPAQDFTAPKTVFLDPNQNRTHDQFAQLLAQHAMNAGITSFGIVAHSQGGCAALHLLTYYESGLDRARGGRRIQSVASPYQGTPLASWGGFACGVNNDMTPSGSATWLAGIPSWARAEVSYWTTADAGNVCNIITSLLLTDPEDGTVEMFRGQLPGGNSMGHTTGWCHTTGMSYPANYTDHARNQAMNTAAAR